MPGRGESAAVIALLRVASGSWREVVEQLEEVGSARALLDSTPERLFETAQPADLEAIDDEIEAWEREGMRFVTVLDADYPENLRGVYDRPPFIFVRGELLGGDAEGVAVVGTRQATPAGLELARAVVAELVAADYTVYSGLALGVDGAAHLAALEHGGRTLALLGTGLRRAYPPAHAALQDRIARECALVSQFWPDAPPTKRSFPMRNAVMSGMALAPWSSRPRRRAEPACRPGSHSSTAGRCSSPRLWSSSTSGRRTTPGGRERTSSTSRRRCRPSCARSRRSTLCSSPDPSGRGRCRAVTLRSSRRYDMWTTGASAQSAAGALLDAGAAVGAVVIGRHIHRDFQENERHLAELPRPFDWSVCPLEG